MIRTFLLWLNSRNLCASLLNFDCFSMKFIIFVENG